MFPNISRNFPGVCCRQFMVLYKYKKGNNTMMVQIYRKPLRYLIGTTKCTKVHEKGFVV